MASQENSVKLWSGDLALVAVNVKQGQRVCKKSATCPTCVVLRRAAYVEQEA